MLYQEDLLARLESGLLGALPMWGLSPRTEVSLISISENATYLAEDKAEGRKLVFRVQRPGYHSEAEIRSELTWIAALRADGVVDAPRPVPALDGALLCGFDDQGGHRRNVVAFEHMSGKAPDTSDDLPRWFRRLGTISAHMHAHGRRWRQPAGFVRKRWDYDSMIGTRPEWGDWRAGPGLDASDKALLGRTAALLKDQLAAYGDGPDRFGLIHADMRPANLLVDGDRLGVIDFDDCGTSWYAFDFAASVGLQEHEPFIPAVRAAWVEGYRAVAPFSEEEERALSMFMMLRRMQLTAWLASHADTPAAKEGGLSLTRGSVELADRYLSGGV